MFPGPRQNAGLDPVGVFTGSAEGLVPPDGDYIADISAGPSRATSRHWRTVLQGRAHALFVVANATFGLLYAVIVLDHHIIHFEVTQSPTQAWLARQITEAFPWDTAPRYLLRDRDTSYGQGFRDRVRIMGIEEVITAHRKIHLSNALSAQSAVNVWITSSSSTSVTCVAYFRYYHESRTHLSLDKDCPET